VLEPVVQVFQHAAGLLAGLAGALDGDVIAARIRHHIEPSLQQSQVLAVLPE
jgi:hypothetical protein